MFWILGIYEIIQIAFTIHFIRRKKYVTVSIIGLINVFITWNYINYYIENVYYNPCEGNEDVCMNETGAIFIFLLILMFFHTILSIVALMIDKAVENHFQNKLEEKEKQQ